MENGFTTTLANDSGGGVSLEPTLNQYENLTRGIDKSHEDIMGKLGAIHKHMEDLPKQTADALAPYFERLATRNAETETGKSINQLANELVTENKALETDKTDLEARLTTAQATIEKHAGVETELRNDILDLRRKVARLEQEKVQFKSIILENAANQKFTDQDVIQAFSDLRQSVQQLARNSIFDFTTIPLLPIDGKKQKLRHFCNITRGLSPKDVGFRLRWQIFEILYRYVLSKTCFGLKRKNNEGSNGDQWNIENALGEFEDLLLDDSKVNKAKVTEWRISTLECIGMLNVPDDYKIWVANNVDMFIDPFISRKFTQLQRDELWDKTVEVCEKAIKLKHMMQQSKEGYMVHFFDPKDRPLYSNMEAYAEEMGVENGRAMDKSDEIAYVLFGGLAKCSRQVGGEWKTLEKAEVVLKRKPKGVFSNLSNATFGAPFWASYDSDF